MKRIHPDLRNQESRDRLFYRRVSMRRIALIVSLLLIVALASFAQTPFDDYEASIQEFANGVANSLPLNSSVGLTWSDSYIGQLPHFGVGATVGFSTVPYGAVKPVLTALDLAGTLEASEIFSYVEQYGAPLPAYTAEARIGGFILPFDAGVKLGAIPPDVDTTALLDGFDFDYLLAGADVRLRLIEEGLLLPELSVGAGYNYLRASIGLTGLAGGQIDITSFEDPRPSGVGTVNLWLTDPTVEYYWQSNIVDLTAQVSKKLLIFTPYAGFGAAVGFGSAGGGLSSTLENDGGLTAADFAEINDALAQAGGETLPVFDEAGFSVTADMPAGWAFRVYGGTSINLLALKIDITAMYDFIGQNYGVTLGTRLQF
jgi:hypothetical protein